MAMINEDQAKELSALVDWLHTFDAFQFQFGDPTVLQKDLSKIIEELSSSEVTRYVKLSLS
jgi:hypothetical protein